MTTATATRDDTAIQNDLLAELKWEAQVQPNEVGVVVRDGVVTLTGWVDSYARRWAAERTAHRVRGVRGVANDIEVRFHGSAAPTDTDIAKAASRALDWDSFVPVEQIDVTVANGWVVLRGEVDWGYQKQAAERDLGRLSGVRGITNLISVRPGERVTPQERERDIRRALARVIEDNADKIVVRIEADTVILAGTVRSWMEREEARRVAWSSPGVREVDDRLGMGI
ncbi:osmotically-inducible protein OsmY [Micromonospora pisi]|uniref:Osmotically-inducible protein OsmY n=1 Tax=Micromonospora pisi TaxID=589240 RepID=A0A495JGS7_9ACTN|nr:BON domain-containing protein [Micromonospora pisi]RKR88206.1 osmotically-inducible protein OsmY [Micromonospora pisi]